MDPSDYVIKNENDEDETQNTITASDNILLVCDMITEHIPKDEPQSKDPVFVTSSNEFKSEFNENEVFGNMERECIISETESDNSNSSLDSANINKLQLSDIEDDVSSVSSISYPISDHTPFNLSFEEVTVAETSVCSTIYDDENYDIAFAESANAEQIALKQLKELDNECSDNVTRHFNQAETIQQNNELNNYERELLFSYVLQENNEVVDMEEALQAQQNMLMMYNKNKKKSDNPDMNGQTNKHKFLARFDNIDEELPSTSKKVKTGREGNQTVLESNHALSKLFDLESDNDNLFYCYEIPQASMEQIVSPSHITSFIVNDDGTLMSCDDKENSNEIGCDIDSIGIEALNLEELDKLIAAQDIVIEEIKENHGSISNNVTSQAEQQNFDLSKNDNEALYPYVKNNVEEHIGFEKSLHVKKKSPMMHKPNRRLNNNSRKTKQENKFNIKNASVPGSKSISTNRNNFKRVGNISSDAKKYDALLESDLEESENIPLDINEQVPSTVRESSQQFYTTPIANELDDNSESNSTIQMELPSTSVYNKCNKTMKSEYKCHRCGFLLSTLVEYCSHVSVCDARSENRYCNECQYLFRSGEMLQQHNIDYHNGENGKRFDRERQLSHDSNSGGEIKEGNCSICSQIFFYRSPKGSNKSQRTCQTCFYVISESASSAENC
ncbi:uncharacterized protein LOC119662461 [Teleopsis dalmanni]|uniref:uncharacterized protein LOC119662461 n=1 Tax=Teleopsis dalmanni TaxID=139649 RepID=UPI0018CD8F40|nr:uncharacterized protein LOC119662461 [Teleopsis dalmanni]XP_037928010.1 uncharacterized protein LOC119662461 [Teleopsis dalmanni]XP_037928011.1 uncharacterized protein LOC119662461 [Teleopsis dalmanni]